MKQKVPKEYRGGAITRRGRRIEWRGPACGSMWRVGGGNWRSIKKVVDMAKDCRLDPTIHQVERRWLPGAKRILGGKR